MIAKIIGFVFIIFGLVWSLLNKVLCKNLCVDCLYQQISPCLFLFLFVGIVMIINGSSLILREINRHS